MKGLNSHIINKILLSFLAALLFAGAAFGLVDQYGKKYTDDAFERAIITFGVARGLNGVISVAQGTEVAIHPAGLGINFTPGQILDPINDLIEQFSWVMLASSASLGIQKIFLTICSTWVVTALLLALLAIMVFYLWKPQTLPSGWVKAMQSLLLIVLFVRFSVPLAAIGSEVFYQYFLSDQYKQATSQLEQTKEKISSLNSSLQTQKEPDNLLDKAKGWLDSASNLVDMESRLEDYKQAATDASRHAINLTVVFLIQTVIFPVMFLWIVYRFIRNIRLVRA